MIIKGASAVDKIEETFSPYTCGIIYMIVCSITYSSLGLFVNLVNKRNQMGLG